MRYRERVSSELWHSRRLRHANRRIAYLVPGRRRERPLGELINLDDVRGLRRAYTFESRP